MLCAPSKTSTARRIPRAGVRSEAVLFFEHMLRPHESLQVSETRWKEAQKFERDCWAAANRRNGLLKLGKRLLLAAAHPLRLARIVRYRDWYCGDDWNYWWLEAFEEYRTLPRRIERALEVGSGPYSNVRLIRRVVSIGEITCADPLMEEYLCYRHTWVATQAMRGSIRAVTCPGESLPFPDMAFDLVVCVNVLDHVQSLPLCFDEMYRVLIPGGHFVLGQELTNSRDFALDDVRSDVGHPIKLEHDTLDSHLEGRFVPVFERLLPRERGRGPFAHYGTRLLIARRL